MSIRTVAIYAVEQSPSPTGIYRYTATLAAELAAQNNAPRVTILIGPWQRAGYERLLPPDSKVTLHELPVRNSLLGRYVLNVLAALGFALRDRPDVLHVAYQSSAVLLRAVVATTVTIHDLYAFTEPQSLAASNRILNQFIGWLCIKLSRRVIVISNATLSALGRYFPRDVGKTRLVYQPVRTPSPPALARTHRVLMVAGHRKHKNIDLAIRALSSLVEAKRLSDDYVLTVVGAEGTETAKLAEQAASSAIRVEFLSSVPEADLVRLYAGSELTVIASSDEGFCLPAVEAVQLGCRLVCSDISVLREVVGDRPTYFDLRAPKPHEALADAVLTALAKPSPAPDPNWMRSADYGATMLGLYHEVSGR